MQPLTDRQQEILRFIRESIRTRGYPPTLREIGTKMDIKSTNGVSDHLRALERKGYLRREDMKSRALRPVEHPEEEPLEEDFSRANTVEIPLVGRVAAGAFALTADTCEGTITVDRGMLPRTGATGDLFALRVKGDSMIEAGILEDDTLFVRRTPAAARGEIVVARLGEEATVKRYFPEKEHIRLQPENKRLSPILVRRTEVAVKGFELLGVVVGLFRSIR